MAIVDDRTAYGQGLADEFRKSAEAAGLKVVASEYTNDKATDFKAILTKIKSTKADLVFWRHGRPGRPHGQADEGTRHQGQVPRRRRRVRRNS